MYQEIQITVLMEIEEPLLEMLVHQILELAKEAATTTDQHLLQLGIEMLHGEAAKQLNLQQGQEVRDRHRHIRRLRLLQDLMKVQGQAVQLVQIEVQVPAVNQTTEENVNSLHLMNRRET